MRNRGNVLAASLSMALLAGGCGESARSSSLRVGADTWVPVEKPVTQHYKNGNKRLQAGDQCVMVRGAKLLLKGEQVVYKNKNALGTECPNGAVVSITSQAAVEQDAIYKAYETRRQDVTEQIRAMHEPTEDPVPANKGWVDLVNPTPIVQEFANGTIEISYGDSCNVTGKIQKVGQLTTGEAVMRVVNPGQIGTQCPTGALYIAPVTH